MPRSTAPSTRCTAPRRSLPAPGGDRDRIEHLFERYAALVDPLATAGGKANARVVRRAARTAD